VGADEEGEEPEDETHGGPHDAEAGHCEGGGGDVELQVHDDAVADDGAQDGHARPQDAPATRRQRERQVGPAAAAAAARVPVLSGGARFSAAVRTCER